jgi:hypothetical protein
MSVGYSWVDGCAVLTCSTCGAGVARLQLASRAPSVTTGLTDDQIDQVVRHSLVGRQNSYKRAMRKDAQAARGSAACMEMTSRHWHRLFGDAERVLVLRADASPMNPKRILLQLACGHEVWSPRRRKYAACASCAQDPERASRAEA